GPPGQDHQSRRAGNQLRRRPRRHHHRAGAGILMQPSNLPAPRGRPVAHGPAGAATSPVEYARLLLKEGRRRIVPLSLIFAAVAALAYLAGMLLVGNSYRVSVTILAQDSDIIAPLLEGRAVPTGV